MFTSAPKYPQPDPVGLSVWYSEHSDDQNDDLLAWQPYTGKSAACNGSFAAAVVCPGMVPDSVGAGYIGDNYVWRAEDGTYYLLSGSNKCIENNGTNIHTYKTKPSLLTQIARARFATKNCLLPHQGWAALLSPTWYVVTQLQPSPPSPRALPPPRILSYPYVCMPCDAKPVV